MNWFEIEQIKPIGVEVVKLDPKTRKGELTFKVTNVSGKALRAGEVVFPRADEQKAWISIRGEEIQEMLDSCLGLVWVRGEELKGIHLSMVISDDGDVTDSKINWGDTDIGAASTIYAFGGSYQEWSGYGEIEVKSRKKVLMIRAGP